ncbi:zinc finger domain-containing protein [Streptomyces antimycoticus]
MNRSEAAQLLARCAAFDNRTVGKADATAWAAALRDVPLDDDAFDAVARFYGTPSEKPGERLWIQPHNVKAHRLAIRKERLGTTLPAYEPPSELETGSDFISRRRAQLEAVATGRMPGAPVGELTGGPHPSVAERLSGLLALVGREVPAEDPEVAEVRRPGPLGVKCPKCSAPIGRPCRTPGGKERAPHPARGKPPSDPEAEQREMERRREASRRHLARLENQPTTTEETQ